VFDITSVEEKHTLSGLVGVDDRGRHLVGEVAEDDPRNKWSI